MRDLLQNLPYVVKVIGLVWLTGWLWALGVIGWMLTHERRHGLPRSTAPGVALMVLCSVVSWPLVLGWVVWLFVLRRRE